MPSECWPTWRSDSMSPADASSSSPAALPSHGGGNGAAPLAVARTKSAYTAANRDLGAATASATAPEFNLEGLLRDERGIRMAKESED